MKYVDPIILRTKKLKNGNESLYLESKIGKNRTCECLKLYLIPELTEADREKNELTMRLAQSVRAERYKAFAENNSETGLTNNIPGDILLVDFIDDYDKVLLSKGCLTEKTVYHYLARHIRSFAPKTKLREVNRFFIEQLFEKIIKTGCLGTSHKGRALSEKRIRNYSEGMSCILNRAVKKGIIPNNPLLFTKYKATRVKTKNVKDYLTMSELKLLIDTPCDKQEARTLFIFGCATGLRYGDIKSLQWKHIQKTNNGLQIEKIQNKTKNKVYIPLGKLAMSVLPERGNAKDEDYVFNTVTKFQTLSEHIKKWVKKAGIEGKNITFYCSRHTFCTLGFDLSEDLETTSSLMGHECIEDTLIYAHITDRRKIAVADKIDNLFKNTYRTRIPWEKAKPKKP